MKLRRSLPVLAAAAMAAGCQAAAKSGYVETVPGDYRDLASCFAGQQVGEDFDDAAGDRNRLLARRIVVDDPVRRVVEVDVGGGNAIYVRQYRVTFSGIGENATELRGQPFPSAPFYWWPEQVMPLIARCTGRIRT